MKYELKLDITLPTLFYRKGEILNNIEVSRLFSEGFMDILAFSDIFDEYLDEHLDGESVEEAPEPTSEERPKDKDSVTTCCEADWIMITSEANAKKYGRRTIPICTKCGKSIYPPLELKVVQQETTPASPSEEIEELLCPDDMFGENCKASWDTFNKVNQLVREVNKLIKKNK